MIKPYVDKNPCIDEYADDWTLTIRGWSLIGLEVHRHLLGVVLLNQAAGIWNDTEAKYGSYFDSVSLWPLLVYVAKLAALVFAAVQVWRLL